MTIAEIAASCAVAFSVLSAIGNTLYMRGKLDAHAGSAEKRLDAFGITIDRLDKVSDDLREKAASVGTGLAYHEKECLRRQEAIEGRFDRMDRASENLAAQMARLTPADTFVQVLPGTRARGAP